MDLWDIGCVGSRISPHARPLGSARHLLWQHTMPNDRDHYQLGELLGRGGMGQVHAARHRSGQQVAIKRVRNTLAIDRMLLDRLEDEARLLRSVSHPNVVRGLDNGTDAEGMPFLVMDRAHGTPLNLVIGEHGPLPRERMIAIAAQLFAGIAAIHDAQIVHADIKSHNILVDEVDIVTIIDFGLARAMAKADDSLDGLVAGTPAYMAPELISGTQPTIAADVYATATVLYEMLTGSTPFTGHISTILTRQLSEIVEPPSLRAPGRGISPSLDRVVMRGLDANPARRYHSIPEFAADFVAAVDDGRTRDAAFARGTAVRLDRPAPRASILPAPPPGLPARPALPEDHILVRGEAMIASVLDRAQQLIAGRQPIAAVEHLEQALEQLAPPVDSEQPMPAIAWRVETVLAALYDSIGKQDHARRLALVAYRHALHTGCPMAEARARSLVDRLVVKSRRMARGSTSISVLERGGGRGR